jgi:hypothetical protein
MQEKGIIALIALLHSFNVIAYKCEFCLYFSLKERLEPKFPKRLSERMKQLVHSKFIGIKNIIKTLNNEYYCTRSLDLFSKSRYTIPSNWLMP